MALDFSEVNRITKEFIEKGGGYTAGVDLAVLPDKANISYWRRRKRGMSVGDLAELIGEYDWSQQLNVLEYMKQFKTWDALYDDLEQRIAGSNSGIRNVTPEKPKQLRETNE